MRFSFFILLAICWRCTPETNPHGAYMGLLPFESITYHIYLDYSQHPAVVMNTTFKASAFPLDTIYFTNDSLFFRLQEFYSEFKGAYDSRLDQISGQWIDEDSVAHPLTFRQANPDTVSGLRPRLTPNYVYHYPLREGDGLNTGNLVDHGVQVGALESITHDIIAGEIQDIHSLLVARNRELVYEEYFYRYNKDFVYNIQSATKSVVSALVGIALDKGEIKSLDETLCADLPGYERYACSPANKNITLRQLMTMTTGIAWDERTYDYGDDRNSLAIAANARDQFEYLLQKPHVKSDTPVFAYNSLNHSLINGVLRHATGLENEVELKQRLLEPLGIVKVNVGEVTPMGVMGDIGLRPRDMIKFGMLYVHKGNWNGKQIIPSSWIKISTTPKVVPSPGLGYGYFWWTKDFDWKGKKVNSFFAWGYGGQYIFVIPELEFVIVMSGSRWTTDPVGPAMGIVQRILDASEPSLPTCE